MVHVLVLIKASVGAIMSCVTVSAHKDFLAGQRWMEANMTNAFNGGTRDHSHKGRRRHQHSSWCRSGTGSKCRVTPDTFVAGVLLGDEAGFGRREGWRLGWWGW